MSSLEISDQTAGHDAAALARAKSDEMSGKFGREMAVADEASRRRLAKCILGKDCKYAAV